MNKIIALLFLLLLNFNLSKAQWISQQSGTANTLTDIEFINKNTGWCCGYAGTILKTTNGGENWNNQTTNVLTKPLFGIHPVNDSVVYSVGWFGTILKTTNGGTKWIQIENGTADDGNYFCVFFINELTGWISENDDSRGYVRKTTDGGKSFISSDIFGWPNDLYFKDSLNGIGVSGAATIHKTTDGGSNWLTFSIAGSGDFNRVTFVNENTGFVVGEYSHKVYRTLDFGTNWSEIAIVQDVKEASRSIKFSSDSIGWIGGNFDRLFKSTNGGYNWHRENITTGYITNISAYNDSILWTCGTVGNIFHTVSGGEPLVGIESVSAKIPEAFLLKQNYPNPFNSETNIEFDINLKNEYSLEVLNILGQRIEILFERNLDPGSYIYSYNVTNFSSGVYFYKLSSENLTITRQFILIK